MTREEEIINTARERANRHQIAEMELYKGDKCNYSYERIYNSEISSFEAGVKWADDHFKNPWINVNDGLPSENTTVFILTQFGDYTTGYLYMDNEWYSDLDGYDTYVEYWMPIPELG